MFDPRGQKVSLGRTWLLLLLAGVLTSALPSASLAADDGAREEARQAFEQGRRLYEKRRYLKAVKVFERAYELRAHFTVLCTIARCYEELNEFVKAKSYYRRCLDGGASTRPMAREIRRSLREVSSQLTWLSVSSPGAGGTVHVNGSSVGQAPVRIAVNPGTHSVEVRRPSATPAHASITTLGGENRSLTLVPLEIKPELPAQHGGVRAPASAPATDTMNRGGSPWWFWGGAVLTAGLAATATVLSVQTLSRKSAYEETPTERGYDAFAERRLLANIFWAASAAAGVSTTVLYFFTDFGSGREKQTDRQATTLGLGLRGRF